MEANDEIKFLLNFDFKNAGAKEAEDFLTRFIAYTSDYNAIIATGTPLIERYQQKLQDVDAIVKKLSLTTNEKNQIDKEARLAIQLAYEDAVKQKKVLDDLILSQRGVSKTTEEMAGEMSKAASMVKTLAGKMKEMEVNGTAVGAKYEELTKKLNTWKAVLIEARVEVDGFAASQEEANGIITQTKERIKELNLLLDGFVDVQGLASAEAQEYKLELQAQNAILAILNKETSASITLEKALADTRATNIRMLNEITAIEERSIDTKATLIIKEKEYSAEVANEVNKRLTGYTLEEEALIKKQKLEQDAFEKAWVEGEMWLKHQEEIFNKAWIAGEQYQKREDLNRLKAIRSIEIQGAKEALMIQKVADEHEKGGQKAIWSLDNIIQKIDFMGVRMIASLFWWTIIIGTVTALYEWWTKIGDAQQIALDRLKDYFNAFKDFQKEKFDLVPKTQADIVITQNNVQRDSDEMNRELNEGTHEGKEKAYNKYLQMQNDGGKKILDDVSKEAFMRDGLTQRMKDQISLLKDSYLPLMSNITAETLKQKTSTELYYKNLSDQEQLQKKIVNDVRNNTIESIKFWDLTGKRASKLTDSQIISSLKKNVTGEQPDDVNMIESGQSQLVIDSKKLNALVSQQKINTSDYTKSQNLLNKLAVQQTNLEGNTKDLKERKSPKGKNLLNEDLRNQEDDSKLRQLGLQKGYEDNQPYNSFDDDDALAKKKIAEALDNVNKKIAIIKLYHGTIYEDEGEFKDKMKKAEIEQMELDNRKSENEARIAKERKDRLSKAIQEFESFTDEMKKLNEKLNQLQIKQKGEKIQQGKDLKNASYVNPFLATAGVEDSNADFQQQLEKLNNQITTKQSEISSKQKEIDYFKEQASLSRQWLDTNKSPNQTDQQAAAEDKSGIFGKQLKDNEDANKNASGASSDKEGKVSELNQLNSDKDVAMAKKKAEMKKAIEKQSFDLSVKLVNDAYNLQKQRIDQQIADTQARYSLEMSLAGNNSAARIRLELAQHSQILALKRKQAETEKQQGIFTALIDTYKGVAAAIGSGPPPYNIILAAISLAAGLEAVNAIQQKPLPSYKTGRKGGEKELARVAEEGFELGIKGNKIRIFEDDQVAQLQEGESVYTHQESNKFMKDLLKGTGVMTASKSQVIPHIGLTKKDFQDALRDELKNMKQPSVILPAQSIQDRLTRTQQRNGL